MYVIKVLGAGRELPDWRGAIRFVLGSPFIHVYNIGMRDLEEVAANLALVEGKE
ncbi:MAG: hypothetical protein AB1445_11935 [Bacillota bacterium]